MRNLKKVLTLVLCLAMMMSIMVVGAGAAFKDQEKIVNDEAVDMCVALNIISGYPDGSYKPEGNVTRAQMCKMICIALNGGKEPATATKAVPTFSDIGGNWAEGYIEYCYAKGIVAGVGGGKFNPDGNVTASQAAKMLLVALGYNADVEKYVGASWELYVNVQANQDGLYEDLENIDTAAALSRDNAAQMIWNTLNAKEIVKSSSIDRTDGSIIDSYTKGTDSLLTAKYGTSEATGTMTYFSYNSDKAEWTYTVGNNSFTTDQDFTDLYQQDVKVIYKNKDVYGIFANDAVVIVEDIIGNIKDLTKLTSSSDKVTVSGTEYKLESVTGYYFGAGQIGDIRDVFALPGYEAFSFVAIDNNDNGKIDTVVVYPFSVAKVTYVGSKTFTAGATYKFEDVNVYDGVAKDDYVIVTAAANAADKTVQIEKAEIVSGEVTVVNGSDYTIGGKVYTLGSNVDQNYLSLGNEVEVVVVNGYIMAEVGLVSGTIAMDEVVYIDATEVKTSYGKETLMAKAYFADGSTQDIEIKSVDGTKAVNSSDKVDSSVVSALSASALWTYELDGSKYELKAITTGSKADFDDSASVTSAGDDRIGTYRVNDAAVIFVKDGDGDVTVLTGAAVKDWSKGTAATGTVYVNETSGFNYVELAALTVAGDVPGAAYDDVYGYVVATLGQTKENNKNYSSYSVWTGSSTEPVTIKVETAKAGGADKGDFIKVSDDAITVIGTEAAVLAYDGEYVSFRGVTGEFKITDDTQIIYVNTDDVAGAEGGSIVEATDHNTAGTYENNVVYLADTAAGKTNELLVLFVDVNNELAD